MEGIKRCPKCGGNVFVAWDFGDGEILEYNTLMDTVSHTYNNPGEFIVQLIVETEIFGINYSDTVIQSISVLVSPDAEIIVDNNCFGDTTKFFDGSMISGAPIISWSWNFGDNTTSSLQHPSHRAKLPSTMHQSRPMRPGSMPEHFGRGCG